MDVIEAVRLQVDALSENPSRDELWAIVTLGVPALIKEARRARFADLEAMTEAQLRDVANRAWNALSSRTVAGGAK